jgi:hypothetical protein
MSVAYTPQSRKIMFHGTASPTQIPAIPNATLDVAVSVVERAVCSLLTDLEEVIEKKADKPSENSQIGLGRLQRFLQAVPDGERTMPDVDLRIMGEFARAIDSGDWWKAEELLERFHDHPDRLSKLFIPMTPDDIKEQMLDRLSRATHPSRSVAALEKRDYEIINVSQYLLSTNGILH